VGAFATAAQGALADTALQDASAFATSAQGALADTALQNALAFATAAQGATADTATQPGDLGTAAAQNSSAFATAAQGATADTALQNAAAFATASQGALADTALQNAAAFATAAQGTTADLAAPKASPTFTGTTTTAALTATDLVVTKDFPRVDVTGGFPALQLTDSGAALNQKVWRISSNSSGELLFSVRSDDLASSAVAFKVTRSGTAITGIDLTSGVAVTVPVPTTTGHALRWGSAANVAALTATGTTIVPTPTADTHAATKLYVDQAEAASQPLDAVLTATTASFTTADETKLDYYAPYIQYGSEEIVIDGTGYATIDFPGPNFTSPPTIQLTLDINSSGAWTVQGVAKIGNIQFVRIFNGGTLQTSGTRTVHWTAMGTSV
tara:strand:+ start:488 stop:1642 length:1155 start_codon:yes stop_codon:yes gene_type:complete